MPCYQIFTNRKVDNLYKIHHFRDMNTVLNRTVVINVVGLSQSLLGRMPRLAAWAAGHKVTSFAPEFPAVTCAAQSSYLTGRSPWGKLGHGIVGNGWYNREQSEVQFWKQSNHLVHGDKIWDVLRREYGKAFSCAQLFWWYNMYSSADWTMTPRPMYPADGRKVFDIYTQPMELRESVKDALGDFPFPSFWGPRAGIASSQWIARSAEWVEEQNTPSLSFVYLPHLDYCLQKVGPEDASIESELLGLDAIMGRLLDFYERRGVQVLVLSEYGISPVNQPIYLNRLFRQQGWIAIKNELGREQLDAGASAVFAVVDHQVAHIYVRNKEKVEEVKTFLEQISGVDEVRIPSWEYGAEGAGQERAGDLIVVAEPQAWFAYYYWMDDNLAPDYARCIDIHRKPGYDPVELYIDPQLTCPLWTVGLFLAKKKLGMRALMEVIPLDATLLKGSHGRDRVPVQEQPVFIGAQHLPLVEKPQDVFEAILSAVRGH